MKVNTISDSFLIERKNLMRKLLIAIVSLVLTFSGFAASPAHASVLVDGTYDCVTGLPSNDPPLAGEMPGLVIVNKVLISSWGCTLGNPYDNTPLFTVTIPDGTTELGPYSLGWLHKVTSISIPNSVSRISDGAFVDCRITSISIPASVTYIGEQAFFACRNLTTVTFETGSNLQTISDDVFQQTAVTSLTLPASLEYFGYMDRQQTPLRTVIFEANSRLQSVLSLVEAPFLTSIQFGTGSNFVIDDGVIYNPARTDLFMYPRARTGNFVIPATVTRIAERAFKNTQITQIHIPASVRSIDSEAFANTELLTSVTFAPGIQLEEIQEEVFYASGITEIIIPASVRHVREGAFAETYSLVSVLFANGSILETIEGEAFYYSNLSSIILPATVQSIGYGAFSDNGSLSSATFANGSTIQSIGDSAFAYTGITSISIPTTVNFIGSNAFNSPQLASITVMEPNAAYTALDGVLFNEQVTLLLQYPTRKADKFYLIPSTVQTIQSFAFTGNLFLISVSIPPRVTTIQSGAFSGTSALTNVEFHPNSGLTVIQNDVFSFTTSLRTITLPESIEEIHTYSFYGSGIKRLTLLGNEFYWLLSNNQDPEEFMGIEKGTLCIDRNKNWSQIYKDLFGCDYRMSFESNGGSPVSMERFNFSTTGDEDELAPVYSAQISQPSSPIRCGFTFLGWSNFFEGSIVEFPLELTERGDIVFHAKWRENTEEPCDSSVVPIPNNQPSPSPTVTETGTTAPVTNSSSSTVTKPVVATVTSYAPKFPIGSASLAKVGQKAIKKIVKKSGTGAIYTITGAASKRSGVPMAFVKALAKLRAEMVKAQLIRLGVKDSNIKVKIKISESSVSPRTKIKVG